MTAPETEMKATTWGPLLRNTTQNNIKFNDTSRIFTILLHNHTDWNLSLSLLCCPVPNTSKLTLSHLIINTFSPGCSLVSVSSQLILSTSQSRPSTSRQRPIFGQTAQTKIFFLIRWVNSTIAVNGILMCIELPIVANHFNMITNNRWEK